MSKVVDGLRGEAFVVAKELGLERIWQPGDEFTDAGPDVLVKAIKAQVFPQTTFEAKELFRQFTKPSGSLSRQSGEAMHSYVARRRRCWKLLTELDTELVLSEGHRADLLLDLSGLDKGERTMIQASIGNVRDFDKIADALVLQPPRIHLSKMSNKVIGSTNNRPFGKGKGKPSKGFLGKGKGKWRSPHAHLTYEDTAFLADEEEPFNDPAYQYADDYECEEDTAAAFVSAEAAAYQTHFDLQEQADESGDWFTGDYSAYLASEWATKWEVADPHDCAELECIAMMFDTLGTDCLADPEACAEFVQSGTAAFVSIKGKGQGKGKGKGGKYPVRPSSLSIEDRRKKLAELKAKTNCKDCGKPGH